MPQFKLTDLVKAGWTIYCETQNINDNMSRPIFLICLQMSIRLGYYVNIFLDF